MPTTHPPSSAEVKKELSYTSTHPMDCPGPATFTFTAIHCLCYRHKHTQIAQKTCTYWYQLCKYKSIGGNYLKITTGPDSAWSDTPLVEPVCARNIVQERLHIISITYSECVYSLSYPARNARAPYCHLWPAPLYHTVPHNLTNGTIFKKQKILNKKCLFWISKQILSETFLILGRAGWDINVLKYI